MEDSILKWATFGIAVVGCVLGVVNYVGDLVRRKPKARATVRYGYKIDGARRHYYGMVEVVNVGECPIYLCQFGLRVPSKNNGFLALGPRLSGGRSVPCRLDPGDFVFCEIDDEIWLSEDVRLADRAFVRISTGKEFFSGRISPDFEALAKSAAESREDGERLLHAIDSFGEGVV